MPPEKVINFAFHLIRKTVPSHYHYHHVEHTQDVFDAAKRIGRSEGISAQEEEILLLAVLFHDTGFAKGKEGHEKWSCEIALQHLPMLGYSTTIIEQVCPIILATRVPQQPANLLQEIICDADLDYLGRDDYALWSDRLYSELKWEDPQLSDKTWRQMQIDFLEQHRYFTQTNIKGRENKKQDNLQLLIHGAYNRNDE
ncbi:HD domain-containing protein [Olivibacter sitiensis]|uniref:HD domain-containing protein n=1 Tax=Olivibacter sitiensis TaxID=376470 RepID=UPI00042866E2|nr:HD domain-containing protein [Olivibacter sitiensis]